MNVTDQMVEAAMDVLAEGGIELHTSARVRDYLPAHDREAAIAALRAADALAYDAACGLVRRAIEAAIGAA